MTNGKSRIIPGNDERQTVFVRNAESGDAQAAADLLRRSITELCAADHQNDPATLERWLRNKTPERFLEWLASPENRVFAAIAGPALAGLGILGISGEIRLCYVLPGMNGRGVGTALLRAMEAEAREMKIERISLESSFTAMGFYKRRGWRPAGEPKPGFGVTMRYPLEKILVQLPLDTERLPHVFYRAWRPAEEWTIDVVPAQGHRLEEYGAAQEGYKAVRLIDVAGRLRAELIWRLATGNNVEITELAVLEPADRRRGMGSALLYAGMDSIRSFRKGKQFEPCKVYAFCEAVNGPGRAFYERHGFAMAAQLPGFYRDCDAILYVREFE